MSKTETAVLANGPNGKPTTVAFTKTQGHTVAAVSKNGEAPKVTTTEAQPMKEEQKRGNKQDILTLWQSCMITFG